MLKSSRKECIVCSWDGVEIHAGLVSVFFVVSVSTLFVFFPNPLGRSRIDDVSNEHGVRFFMLCYVLLRLLLNKCFEVFTAESRRKRNHLSGK